MVPADHPGEDSIALVCQSRTMSTVDVGRSSLSCGLILTMIACMLTASWAVAAVPYSSPAEPVLLDEDDTPSFAGARGAQTSWLSQAGKTSGSSGQYDIAWAEGMDVGPGGTIYVSGMLLGDTTFGSVNLNSGTDQVPFVAKLDSQGNWQWASAASIPGSGWSSSFDVSVDSNGNAFVTGYFQDAIAFGSSTLSTSGGADIFVAKISSSGAWQWATSAGGAGDDEIAVGIAATSTGDAIVVGQTNDSSNFGSNSISTAGGIDAFVAKISASGSWAWATVGGGQGSDFANDVSLDSSDNVFVIGMFQGGTTGAQFGSTQVAATGSMDVFISRLTSTGSWDWTKTAGSGNGGLSGFAIAHGSGSSYVAGYFSGTGNWGSFQKTSTSDCADGYVANIDDYGTWQWVTTAGASGPTYTIVKAVAADSSGNAVIGGEVALVDSLCQQYDTGTTSVSFGLTSVSTNGYNDAFFAAIDSGGNWTNAAVMGGSQMDEARGVGVTSSGEVVVAGRYCYNNPSASCSSTDGGSNSISESSTYGGTFVWNLVGDADGDGVPDSTDNCPMTANANQLDIDGDAVPGVGGGDACDDDIDGDGMLNVDDDCDGPAINWDSSIWADDIDMDGCRDIDEDDDDDNDGVGDVDDGCSGTAYKLNWTAGVANDNDMDGCHDNEEDDDDDNDGIDDGSGDDCPRGSANWGIRVGPGDYTHNTARDHDSDGCEDDHAEDTDDDNDGIDDVDGNNDQLDRCARGQLGWTSDFTLDADGDGCRDSDEDVDDDNDEVWDVDAFGNTLDQCSPGMMNWISTDSTDRDRDGCRDLDEDTDDDGDGVEDDVDDCFQMAMWTSDPSTDHDGDGCRDVDEDLNDDNDPKFDNEDDCALGEVGWTVTDWDGDGCRDESEDPDDDNDGICDNDGSSPGICNSGPDLCAETPLGETTNADGCGMLTQLDTDGDGVYDANDACVNEAALSGYDNNMDGCTDDTDGDGVTDDLDVFPDESTQWSDRDGDTWGDNPSGIRPDQCQDTPAQWVLLAEQRFGCAWEEEDADSDGVVNGYDDCPDTETGREVDASGCSQWQIDDDGDGVFNALDNCADTPTSDEQLDDSGCSHEQRLADGDMDAMLQEYGLIGGISLAVLLLIIVAMSVMLIRRGRKGGATADDWVTDEIQHAAQQQQQMDTVQPAAPAAVAQPQHVADYSGLPLGGDYVTDASGGTWYNAPDGSQWAMQADGSFVRAN